MSFPTLLVIKAFSQYLHGIYFTGYYETERQDIGCFVANQNGATSTRTPDANKTEEMETTKEPYIFPEIENGDALQPTLNLLLSQKHYNEEMDKIYHRMMKKNRLAQYLTQLEATISNTRLVIDNYIESVQEYLTTGAPNDDVRKQPWGGASSDSILNCWRQMREWTDNMRGERIDTEVDDLDRVMDSAIREMEVYEKYSDMLYEEMMETAVTEKTTNSLLIE